MPSIFCIDTSALIESWWNHYRPGSFRTFWSKMDEAIEEGILVSPMLVYLELERKDDELFQWARERQKLFLPLTTELQSAQKEIINRFSKLTNEGKGRSLCDPWVVALAQLKNCPVVTQEDYGSAQRPRIPDVCKTLGVGCIKMADLIEVLNWSF